MRAAFRRLLLTCLILVLPLEAFASAAMLGCVQSHPAGHAAAMSAAMPGCHDEAPAQPAVPSHHDCKHCAVCYLASALPIPMLAVAPAERPPVRYPRVATSRFDGFIPDGPERPPRTLLA